MPYHDNDGYQRTLLKEIRPGSVLVTSGGRLARCLKHRFRVARMMEGKQGWTPPDIFTLNAWARRTWNRTWSHTGPLPPVRALALWKKTLSMAPPPEPFLPDPALCQTLDETYTVLTRHGLSTQGPSAGTMPILSWRQAAFDCFEALAEEQRAFHPALLPVHLSRSIQEGRLRLPETIVLAGFESPAPVEETLLAALAGRVSLKRLGLPGGTPETIQGLVLPSRDDEVAWLAQQLIVDAQTLPLNRIGVVVPETDKYVSLLKQTLQDIMGKPSDGAASAYNISAGTPLLQRSLVQAGLLPLRFWNEGEPRTLLLSMILSPYYSGWSGTRDHPAEADRCWRSCGVDRGLTDLCNVLSHMRPDLFQQLDEGPSPLRALLVVFREKSRRTGEAWVRLLDAFWNRAGFPVKSDEADTGAWRHLKTILYGLGESLKTYDLSLGEFTAFLRHVLSQEQVHVRGSEEAGIQILGLIESRGLFFSKLYVLGLSGGSLPLPVRPLPLLDPVERRHVQGATVESQYIFAREAFSHLLACAPHVTLMRPEEDSAEPLAPSPFFMAPVKEESRPKMDVWNDPGQAWTRAPWLRRAKAGLKHPRSFPPPDPPLRACKLPETLSVAQLSTAFSCPFRFFVEIFLKIDPLDEVIPGITPRDRGKILHRVLALFTQRWRNTNTKAGAGDGQMKQMLAECADEILTGPRPAIDPVERHGWIMERRRWMDGKGRAPGLLEKWLCLEQERLNNGWQWLCEESSFDGLTSPDWPFSVRGRVDRIDHHEQKGLMLWDYKSGDPPPGRVVTQAFSDPQIPAYLAAAKENRIPEIRGLWGTDVNMSAGFIALTMPSGVTYTDLMPKTDNWKPVLERWTEAVAQLGHLLRSGRFDALPYPVSTSADPKKSCRYCPYDALCGRTRAGEEPAGATG